MVFYPQVCRRKTYLYKHKEIFIIEKSLKKSFKVRNKWGYIIFSYLKVIFKSIIFFFYLFLHKSNNGPENQILHSLHFFDILKSTLAFKKMAFSKKNLVILSFNNFLWHMIFAHYPHTHITYSLSQCTLTLSHTSYTLFYLVALRKRRCKKHSKKNIVRKAIIYNRFLIFSKYWWRCYSENHKIYDNWLFLTLFSYLLKTEGRRKEEWSSITSFKPFISCCYLWWSFYHGLIYEKNYNSVFKVGVFWDTPFTWEAYQVKLL